MGWRTICISVALLLVCSASNWEYFGFGNPDRADGRTAPAAELPPLPPAAQPTIPSLSFLQPLGYAAGSPSFIYMGKRMWAGFFEDSIQISVGGTPMEKFGRVDRSKSSSDPVEGEPEASGSLTARMMFEGANHSPPTGRGLIPRSVTWLYGHDLPTSFWSFGEIIYEQLYPGIDLLFSENEGRLKYEYRVSPGVDLHLIRVSYAGRASLSAISPTELIVGTERGGWHETIPASRQASGEPVSCHFAIMSTDEYGFDCVGWNKTQELVIDPLVFSSLLGGSQSDAITDVAVDMQGNIYVVGETSSSPANGLPPNGSVSPLLPYSAYQEVFVAKLAPGGKDLLFFTFLGSSSTDYGRAIAVDAQGRVLVAGRTSGGDFPVGGSGTAVFQAALSGPSDAFLAKLNALGGRIFVTLLGGAGSEIANAVEWDAAGDIVLAGYTTSEDFPVKPKGGPVAQMSYAGEMDAFVAKVKSDGSALLYASFLGGDGQDVAEDLEIEDDGSILVVGSTRARGGASPESFPIVIGDSRVVQPTYGGDTDAFIVRLRPDVSAISFSTFLGGSGSDIAFSVSSTLAGGIVVVGSSIRGSATTSIPFPSAGGVQSIGPGGRQDGFLAVLSASGEDLLSSVTIGGSADDLVSDVALVGGTEFVVAGGSKSKDFPTTPGAVDTEFAQSSCSAQTLCDDAFVAKIGVDGHTLQYSTLLGDAGADSASAIVAGTDGTLYVGGVTRSASFVTTEDAFDKVLSDGAYSGDAFLAIIDAAFQVTLISEPPGLLVSIDGQTYRTPFGGWCRAGRLITVVAPPEQAIGEKRYIFSHWSGVDGNSHFEQCDGPINRTAHFSEKSEMSNPVEELIKFFQTFGLEILGGTLGAVVLGLLERRFHWLRHSRDRSGEEMPPNRGTPPEK